VTSVVGHLATGEPSFLEIEEDLVDLVFNNHYFATGKIDKPGLRQLLDENITITSELSTVASVLKSAGYVSKGDVLEKVTKPLQARLEKKLKKLADESLKVSVQERLSGAGALIKEKTTQAAQGVGAIAGELQAARLSQKATSELRAAEKRKEAAEKAQEAQLMEESLEPRDLQIKLSDDIKKLTDERNELTERIDATGLESEKKNLKARGRAIDQKLRALGEELARSIGGGSGE
jgi:chromosome condensin MukBEF ATPase and DNA-binding subunit MukB